MSDIIRRAWAPHLDLEIRGDGRTVYGLAVPFDQPAAVADMIGGRVVRYDEVFRMGAFADTIAQRGERVKFLLNHDKVQASALLGRALELREDPAGLVGAFRISATPQGDAALELIRDGVLDAFSIGFKPITPAGVPTPGALVERTAVKLLEVSAVAFPAYESAAIAGVRSEDLPDQQDGPDQPDEPDQLIAPDLAERRMLALRLKGII